MIDINEYLLSKSKSKLNIIKTTDETIQDIVLDELDRLGHDADLNHIDVSEVTDMSDLFNCEDYLGSKYRDLNPDISHWDVSNVVNMSCMFYNCQKFNQDITQWKVDKVKYTDNMFWNCKNFNQDLSDWNVRNVNIMYGMFWGCPIKEEFKPKFNI